MPDAPVELKRQRYPAPPGLHAQRGAQRGDHFEDHRRGSRCCPGVAAPPAGGVLPGGLPQARFGSRSALITGAPPARLTSRLGWTWTASSTSWVSGSGRGGSLLEGRLVCAELANRGVKDVLIVCCDGLTGLPEANAGSPGPRPRSPPAWIPPSSAPLDTVRLLRGPPEGRGRSQGRLHRPEPGGRLAGSDRLLRVRHGGQVPPDGDDLGAIHSLPGLPANAQACHLSPTSWEVPPPPTVSRLRATSCARITDEPQPLPLR